MRVCIKATLLSLFLLYAFTATPLLAFEASSYGDGWSKTTPAVNLTHVFDGQINRNGKPTGFHHRVMGQDKPAAKLSKLLAGPNKVGIYTALVRILDKSQNIWKEKFSSLFPDRFGKLQVLKAILNAYKNNTLKSGRKWRGPSGFGFMVEGYQLKDGRIITAYPIYAKNE
ncbi:MAG: EndoU domain-containing protein [Sneathiella sp.]